MPFVSVALTHELRLEAYQQEICRLQEESNEKQEEMIKQLKYIALILERDFETGSDISEVSA